jgi:hypothetical protein
MSHKSSKLRELLAEKAPDTVQEAEKIAEAFEVRAKDKPVAQETFSSKSFSGWRFPQNVARKKPKRLKSWTTIAF